MKILILEDDAGTCRLLRAALTEAGLGVETYGSLLHARSAIRAEEFDLYLLDLSLPDGDGLTLCPAIRARSQNPIIMLTMRGAIADIEKGLDQGADDYITKPFQVREVVARVRAQLRRSMRASQAESEHTIRIGELLINRDTRDVFVRGTQAFLSPKEYDILELLALRAGRTVSKDVIVDRLWGEEDVSDKILAVYIRRIRCKIEEDPDNPHFVVTIRGVGYRLGSE